MSARLPSRPRCTLWLSELQPRWTHECRSRRDVRSECLPTKRCSARRKPARAKPNRSLELKRLSNSRSSATASQQRTSSWLSGRPSQFPDWPVVPDLHGSGSSSDSSGASPKTDAEPDFAARAGECSGLAVEGQIPRVIGRPRIRLSAGTTEIRQSPIVRPYPNKLHRTIPSSINFNHL